MPFVGRFGPVLGHFLLIWACFGSFWIRAYFGGSGARFLAYFGDSSLNSGLFWEIRTLIWPILKDWT